MIENDKPFDAYSLRMEEISKRVSNLREELILTLNNVTVDLIRQAINPNINPFSSSVTVKLEELKAVKKRFIHSLEIIERLLMMKQKNLNTMKLEQVFWMGLMMI